ncbi:zinc finger protein 91 [Anopheles nili]|uniref:zinc finger protein 91 n=1 Tax=Anopheles nili TaxID=185578 RepID=UPI00237B62C8|nr:zinc finger protein 91 [Anopheles nili]
MAKEQQSTDQESTQALKAADILSPTSSVASSKTGTTPAHRYKCEFCGKTFKRQDEHDRHRFSHTGVHAYICLEPNCEKVYSNRSHLLRHIRANHLQQTDPKQPTVICKQPNCKMKFTSKQAMKRHYQTKHVIGKPYACEQCSERFWRKLQLKMHKIEHTGQYPHRCEHCNQGFVNLRSMRSHRCTQNTLKCPDCAKEVQRWSELVAHRRLEHPNQFRCEHCSKQFHTKRSLKMHGQVHLTADQRDVYECPYEGCPRFYEHERNLIAHVRSKHEGRKQEEFKCPLADCGRVLASKQKLEQHRKLHLSVSKAARRTKQLDKLPSSERTPADKQEMVAAALAWRGTDATEESKKQCVVTPEKQSYLDVTTDSEVDSALSVPKLLASHLQGLCMQIDALRSDFTMV